MIKIFKKTSNAVGLTQIQTTEALYKQLRQRVEQDIENMAIPAVAIEMNMLLQRLESHVTSYSNINKMVYEQLKQERDDIRGDV